MSSEAQLEGGPQQGLYNVRIDPHAEGISVLFRRRKELRAAAPPGEPEVA